MIFTDLALARLKPPQSGQRLLWDQACKGLALLVSPRGTKAFRVLFKLEGKYQWATLGHYGDVSEDTGKTPTSFGRGMKRGVIALSRNKGSTRVSPRSRVPRPRAAH